MNHSKENCCQAWHFTGVCHITFVLHYQKVCRIWVPCMLTADIKASRSETCQQLLSYYEKKMRNFMTVKETWAPHYDAEQSIGPWTTMAKLHLRKKNAKSMLRQESSLIVFWEAEDVIYMNILESGTTTVSLQSTTL